MKNEWIYIFILLRSNESSTSNQPSKLDVKTILDLAKIFFLSKNKVYYFRFKNIFTFTMETKTH